MVENLESGREEGGSGNNNQDINVAPIGMQNTESAVTIPIQYHKEQMEMDNEMSLQQYVAN